MAVISTTPAQREMLRQRFANLLMSGEVARINFRYGHFHLRPGGYVVIAMSLATRDIHHPGQVDQRRPMDVQVETIPPQADALYRSRTNTIAVPTIDYGQTPAHRAAVVHEATHAIFDYNRVRLTAFEEEACAYIADAMYRQMIGASLPYDMHPVFGAARRIAEGLVATHRLMRPWTDEVTATDMQPLLAALRASPGYSGIASRRASFQYTHDGGTI